MFLGEFDCTHPSRQAGDQSHKILWLEGLGGSNETRKQALPKDSRTLKRCVYIYICIYIYTYHIPYLDNNRI